MDWKNMKPHRLLAIERLVATYHNQEEQARFHCEKSGGNSYSVQKYYIREENKPHDCVVMTKIFR
jgi:hypothetical protein